MDSNAHNQNIDELIIAYFSEGLDEQSLLKLREWVAESQENRDEFLRQQEIWFSSAAAKDTNEYDADNAKKIFRKRVIQAKEASGISRGNKRAFSGIWKFAVAAAVACVIAIMAYWRGGEDIKSDFADIVVEAPLGAKTKLYLPDGTLVWLNAGSKMSYSQGFGVEDRAVKINGEGYFEVAKNEDLPFVVRSSALKVKVVGTKFNFRDYDEDRQASVSLLEGSVELENLIKADYIHRLIPNHRAVLDKTSGEMHFDEVVAANSKVWTNNILLYDDETLEEIAKDLERAFGAEFIFSDASLKNIRFYGCFSIDEQRLDGILKALSSTGKFSYSINKNKVVYLFIQDN